MLSYKMDLVLAPLCRVLANPVTNYAPSYGSVCSIIMDVCQYENCTVKHNKQNKMYFVLTIVVLQRTPLSNLHEDDDSVLKVQNEMIELL